MIKIKKTISVPVHKIKSGCVKAVMWKKLTVENGQKKIEREVILDKLYFDGCWKTTKCLNISDLPKLKSVLAKTYARIIFSNVKD